MSDWRDKVKAARLPETTVPTVMRGDLAAEYEAALRDLEQAKAHRGNSLAGSGEGAVRDRLRDIETQMRDSVVDFRLRALPRNVWRELREAHPPRERDGEMLVEDRLAGGVNVETISEPLVLASVVYPDDMTAEDWETLLPNLTNRQFDELVRAAWDLNTGRVDVPFLSDGSATIPNTGAG